MAIICDTGAIYAIHDADDEHHAAVRVVVERDPGPLLLPSILLAEIDYLLTRRLGSDAALDFLDSVTHGEFGLVSPLMEDLLEKNDRWNAFLEQATQTKFQTNQTELALLVPPRLRNQNFAFRLS
jgi:predicted nucleic acid-binding protein